MALIERLDKYHLCYLIVNDIADDRYAGLSHVAEHTLLIPSDIGLDFSGRGYTCANHVWLCFVSEKLETVVEVDRKIYSGEIFNQETVNRARCQVKEEILRLQEHIVQRKKLICFVTESRVNKFAMGEADQINRIQVSDIKSWFEERKQQGQIYRFIFKDAHEMIVSTPIQDCTMYTDKKLYDFVGCDGEDQILILTPLSKARKIQLYFRIPLIKSKESMIKKAVFEFCIQLKVQYALGIDVEIMDKFFDGDERFSVLNFPWDNMLSFTEIIQKIRQEIDGISSNEFYAYREKFKKYAAAVMKQEKSNAEIMNAIKNHILYAIPKIQLEDLHYIEQVKYDSFPREMITKIPLKVVIT